MTVEELRRVVAAGAAAAVVAVPSSAGAATKNAITPTSPQAGAAVAKGKPLTFRGRVRGSGRVFVHVCTSPRTSRRDGTICTRAAFGQATRRSGRFSFTQRVFDFPEFFLNRPGTYYWQAHRILCRRGDTVDCRQEGPVVRFRVR